MSTPLCRTCRHFQQADLGYTEYHNSVKIKRPSRNYCHEFYVEVEREATNCCKYDDKRNPELGDLERMAYILEKKNVIGFDKPVIEFKKPEKR